MSLLESEKTNNNNNIPDDIIEQIIIRLDVKDIIRCKSVCKWWKSFISGPRFVKSQLDHSYKEDAKTNGSGHRRIVMTRLSYIDSLFRNCLHEVDDYTFDFQVCHLAGSSNGLVCICPDSRRVFVTNPSTREVRKLTDPPGTSCLSSSVSWGFGYDPSTDDYKVIRTSRPDIDALQCFQVLTLKSNAWKCVAHLSYRFVSRIGTLCNGALHWFVEDDAQYNKYLLVSFCLTQQTFKVIPQPKDAGYRFTHDTKLGIFKGCLCILRLGKHPPFHRWVMPSDKSWEKMPHNERLQLDSAHYLESFDHYIADKNDYLAPHKSLFRHGIPFSSVDWEYVNINTPVFVQSLVSPHGSLKRKMLENIASRNHKLLKEDA
uniref:F-box/kelch-repeat protein At3g06240-like isoform X2 n=1 Tax=Erigeron canadensis TaxID=72917 RepID=UPI001CB99FEE|nr:F-box/kelch-repeat protein At3g06240-like isoform X2 [Erigeron canadensis]